MTERAQPTRWTVVQHAGRGIGPARSQFAHTYADLVRQQLAARWRGGCHVEQVDDAVQEVFLECFREGGALARVTREGPGAFRTYLFAVVRNVARRFEERARTRASGGDSILQRQVPARVETPSTALDRAWARGLLARATERQRRQAETADPNARRRVELLELRLVEGLPIRVIADRWGVDATRLHREYARAREEFKRAFRDEVAAASGHGTQVDRIVTRITELFRDETPNSLRETGGGTEPSA